MKSTALPDGLGQAIGLDEVPAVALTRGPQRAQADE